MRFLGIGESNDLAAMYHRLARRGHDVRVYVRRPECRDIFGGLLYFTDDWQRELGWLRGTNGSASAGDTPGIAIFETASMGSVQDALRREGFGVVGGSALGDRLEADRAFGQAVLREAGLRIAGSHAFDNYGSAREFLRRTPGRYVLKFNGAAADRTRNYVSQDVGSADLDALLALYQQQASRAMPAGVPHGEASGNLLANDSAQPTASPNFLLQQHLDGVEVGIGGYFNGEAFLHGACVDFEHKHLFPGELGELTGEMGTIVTYDGHQALFNAVLAPLAPLLRASGYVGYINVNLIANQEGLWPLEFTSRFGYPGYAICEALHQEPWAALFLRLVRRNSLALPTRSGFACGVVLSVPPFPYADGYERLSKGAPVWLRPGLSAAEQVRIHWCEVASMQRSGAMPYTDGHAATLASCAVPSPADPWLMSGTCGQVAVVTGVGSTIQAASTDALRLASHVAAPNLRYRRDIGERVWMRDLAALQQLGWWPQHAFATTECGSRAQASSHPA